MIVFLLGENLATILFQIWCDPKELAQSKSMFTFQQLLGDIFQNQRFFG
jgi:hypothetical protein